MRSTWLRSDGPYEAPRWCASRGASWDRPCTGKVRVSNGTGSQHHDAQVCLGVFRGARFSKRSFDRTPSAARASRAASGRRGLTWEPARPGAPEIPGRFGRLVSGALPRRIVDASSRDGTREWPARGVDRSYTGLDAGAREGATGKIGGEWRADSNRIRAGLRVSEADADDPHAQRALLEGLRPLHPGPRAHRPVDARLRPSRHLRKLMQPHRRSAWTDLHFDRHRQHAPGVGTRSGDL